MRNTESGISFPEQDRGLLKRNSRHDTHNHGGGEVRIPDDYYSGRLPRLLFWKHPAWKGNQEIETTPARLTMLHAGNSVVTGMLFPAAVIVGFTFPNSAAQAAAEVTGLMLGARLSVYLNRRLARSVIK